MILAVFAVLKEIYKQGRDYSWPRPEVCPHCKSGRLWGHGFVPAYFDGFEGGILLRRYRCVECGCVIRLKPQGYFHKFQSSIKAIRSSIRHRLEAGRWVGAISRSRGLHWLKALKRKSRAYLGDAFEGDLLQAFDRLLEMGKIPVSRSI
jgi:hypothetical protein